MLKHGEKIYALVEGGVSPVIMDSEMNFLEEEPFPAADNKRFTAHPKIDSDTGEMHAVSYDFGEYVNGLGQVHYVTIDSNGKLIKIKSLKHQADQWFMIVLLPKIMFLFLICLLRLILVEETMTIILLVEIIQWSGMTNILPE